MNEKISGKISFLSLLYVGIIVLFHSEFRYRFSFITDLTIAANSFFFCVSAFFFYGSDKSTSDKLKKRGATLVLPFFLWNLIYLFVRLFQGAIYPYNILETFTINPLCTPSWYLLSLFIMFLPACLISRILAKKYGALLVFAGGALISVLGFALFPELLLKIPFAGAYLVRICEYVLPYAAGAVMGAKFKNRVSVGIKNAVIGIVVTAAILVLLRFDLSSGLRWFLCVLLPFAVWEAVPESLFVHDGIVGFITAPAFFLNMTHPMLLYFIGFLSMRLQVSNANIHELIRVGLACAASFILFYLMKKICPKVLKLLSGNRVR